MIPILVPHHTFLKEDILKITYEFDTDKESCDFTELHCIQHAEDLARCIYEIQNKIRHWYKYDERTSIPVEEIQEELYEIINEHVNMEKLGY